MASKSSTAQSDPEKLQRVVLDFSHSGGGKNCQTSAMVRLMHHLGHDISEPMLLGISAGMGFVYWFMKMMPYPVIGGMNRADCRKFPGILGKAARRLGGDFESILTKSQAKAHAFLMETLSAGQPGLVCVDIAYLDHLSTGDDDHFGEHNFLVYGVDEVQDLVYISDRFPSTLTMSLKRLKQARASEFKPFPAMNQMVRFTFPKTLTPLKEIIPAAIRENAEALLNPPIANIGVKGILKWSLELSRYPKLIPDPKALVHALMMHYIYIETGGSGGAIFRRIYSDFLREAADAMDDNTLSRASDDYLAISEMWIEVANGLLPDEYPALCELRRIQWESNRIMETEGVTALERVRKLSARVPCLAEEAAKSESTHFVEFIRPVKELLERIHDREFEVMTQLAKHL
ncbi:MAG: BtrH N-terminal domain-containing protein [Candidatus Thorarchaeota archaeon]|nr:BtrH N-terminal domain-containing protein [Candidatus Thorarchaeota archaeon]